MSEFDSIKQSTQNILSAVLNWIPPRASDKADLDAAFSSTGRYIAHHKVHSLTTGFAHAGRDAGAQGFFPLLGSGPHHLQLINHPWQYGVLQAHKVGAFAQWRLVLNPDKAKALAPGEKITEKHKVIISDGFGHHFVKTIAVQLVGHNDAPSIKSDGAGDTASIDHDENVLTVTRVAASDPDHHHKLTYAIAGGLDAAKFMIDPKTGTLSFIAPPDFEHPTDSDADNVYQVIVKVKDGHGGSDTQTISVHVKDVDEAPHVDEAPEITSNGGGAAAAISLHENLQIVTTVVATDPEGATIQYTLDGDDKDLFTIDANGVLKFIAAPDYESPTDQGGDNVYNVIVQASDGTHTTTQALAITILDAAGALSFGFAAGTQDDAADVTTEFTGGGAKVVIDWGDSATSTSDYAQGGSNPFNASHVYAEDFTGTATIKALDDATPVGAEQTFHVQTAVAAGSTLTGGADRDVLIGFAGADVLDGGDGDDLLKGGGGDDHLTGGSGNDILAGGAGADTFHFDAEFGNDLVADFKPTEDFLEFTSVFIDAEALLDATEDVDGHAVIHKGANTIMLDGVVKADLEAHQDHLLFG